MGKEINSIIKICEKEHTPGNVLLKNLEYYLLYSKECKF